MYGEVTIPNYQWEENTESFRNLIWSPSVDLGLDNTHSEIKVPNCIAPVSRVGTIKATSFAPPQMYVSFTWEGVRDAPVVSH